MEGLTLKNIMNVDITATGTAFPSAGRWVHNEDIHALVYGNDWKKVLLEKKRDSLYYERELGFKKRFWVHTPGTPVEHHELTSADLMIAAANNAFNNSNISKNEIDFVIAVTITSPHYSTSMGAFISGALDIEAPAMEMKSGCASNIFSIIIAAQLIQSGARNVLITCGETNTKILDRNSLAYAGGDAGAAIIISKSDSGKKGIAAAYLNTNGSYTGYMGVPGLMPPNKHDLGEGNYYLTYSDVAEDFLNHAWSMTPGILYKTAGMDAKDIDCFIPHQVNKKRTIYASDAAGVSINKTIDIIGDYANCGSASLLLALHHAKKSELLDDNKTALLIAAGGGISWGGIILRT